MLYLPIDKGLIPYTFQTTIGGEDFEFTVKYNARFDFFTMDISKNGQKVMNGDKIVYGRALFETIPDDAAIPKYPITPLSLSGPVERVGWKELSVNVFLVIGDPNG
ncbi:hypothetical protein Sam46_gp18 [Bacillus phage vB_BcM_Sam46]|uniref:Cyanophage baseplate Pam3 plug gp18 domain-containing protein n=2 Tax=Caudoviricetes TaxID=2731619 RepID=A0A6G9L8C3_9CAUD|nr:hypothetical protein Sam112_gp18 [Bacillus phage vB_BcM_Sam112]QIQ61219.1 hypothetical protein Sam46_gp18 [Bacillus phage vB_BcM_Sam46]